MDGAKANWTILTYIAAHNNLAVLGERSLDQILGVGSTAQLKLAALYDGPLSAARYIAGAPDEPDLEEPLPDFDSGDPDALLQTVRWAYEQCPAERYGLILWSHGSGWRPEEIRQVAAQARGDGTVDAAEATERSAAPGSMALFRSTLSRILSLAEPAERAICFDDGTGHSLDTLELARVAAEIREMIGQPLDLLGMDACLMATLEVAYQLREVVRYLVASEELVPGHSWPYDALFGELSAHPGRPGSELATMAVRHYAAFYRDHPPLAGDVTQVALDLSHAGDLVGPADELAAALLAGMDQQADRLWKAQYGAFEQESRGGRRRPTKFDFHLWDIGSLAARLAADGESVAVAEAAGRMAAALQPGGPAALAEAHLGDWFQGIGGVSIYLVPPKKQRISPYYAQVALAKDTRWQEMLAAYHEHYA